MFDGRTELLMLMALVGLPGIGVAAQADDKTLRAAGIVWAALWLLPPLGRLWIAGMAG